MKHWFFGGSGAVQSPSEALPPLVVQSGVGGNSYSLNGPGYFTTLAVPYDQPATGENRMLVAIVLYMAKAAGARAFVLPTWNGDDMVEGLAPNSASDKSGPGCAIYYQANPDTGPADFVIDFGEDMLAAAVVLVSLTRAAQASPIDTTAGGSTTGALATIARTLTTGSPNCLILGGAMLQGWDGAPASLAAGLSAIAAGITNNANTSNDAAFTTGARTAATAGDYGVGATFQVADGLGDGWVAIKGAASSGGGGGVPSTPPTGVRFKPPTPLATVDVLTVTGSGDQTWTGTASKDALVVMPNSEITGQWSVEVKGYRAIYLIGGKVRLRGRGTVTTPDGRTGRGQNWWLWLETHKDAVNAAIYVSRLEVTNDPDDYSVGNSQFGDIFNLGGDVNTTPATNTANWPDLFLDSILVNGGCYGWPQSVSGSFLTHSDLFKCEVGAFKSLNVSRLAAPWGYQAFYSTPSYASGFRAHPTGKVELYDVALETIRTKGNGANWWQASPKALFLSRGSANVDAGEYYPHIFHEGGAEGGGVWLSSPIVDGNFHPGGGTYAPAYVAGPPARWEWPNVNPPGGRGKLVTGRILAGSPPSPVVQSSDVGLAFRIVDKSALESLIAAL